MIIRMAGRPNEEMIDYGSSMLLFDNYNNSLSTYHMKKKVIK